MKAALAWLVQLFGAVCTIIGMAHIAIGPAAIPGGVVTNATMDSEDRFYATLFVGFGLAMIWCGRDLVTRARLFHCLLAIFFAGGIARLVSIAQVGLPNALLQLLTAVELILPVLLWWWFAKLYPERR